jgi:hypothetical protein
MRTPSGVRRHFLSKEGQRIEVPARFQPLREYLEVHLKGGEF